MPKLLNPRNSLKGKLYLNSWQKRMVEIVGLLILSPIIILLIVVSAIIIKFEDGGKFFYTQNRIGKEGKEFKIYKLRTMQVSSLQYKFPQNNNDNRVTKIGKIIRPLAIDESPQLLINMLFKGNMSIFGIRALATEQYNEIINLHITHPKVFSEELINKWKEAYDIAVPGGLSLSMVKGRSSLFLDYESLKKKLLFDIEYIKRASFSFDLWVLKETIHSFVKGKGTW